MKIALFGYGKMGKTIEQLALQKGHTIVLKTSGKSSLEKAIEADVAIDFSTPKAAASNIKFCLERQIPIVCGTTGKGRMKQNNRVTRVNLRSTENLLAEPKFGWYSLYPKSFVE